MGDARTYRAAAAIVAIAAVLATGCSAGPEGSGADEMAPAASVSATATTPAPATPEVIDVPELPAGQPASVDHLAGGVLSRDGRSVSTDFPADAVDPQLLGAVGGSVVVTAYQAGGGDPGVRFWSIDSSGHAQRLGGTYRVYDYTPRLVASTGHLWVHYADRTSPRTIWELDARTGREIAVYDHNQVPRGLARADQALVDAWVARRRAVSDTEARTRDGALVARTRSAYLGPGSNGESVVVRHVSDRSLVRRFTFPNGVGGGVSRVVFEDSEHVLVLTTVSFTRRHGPQQAIVRCSVVDGSCERATAVGGTMALGVVRPLFVR